MTKRRDIRFRRRAADEPSKKTPNDRIKNFAHDPAIVTGLITGSRSDQWMVFSVGTAVIPGCQTLEVPAPDHFVGRVKIGIGAVRGLYDFDVRLLDIDPPNSARLVGTGGGSIGTGAGEGIITLISDEAGGSRLEYRYSAEVSGKVAAVGGRMVDAAARMLARQFFEALARHTGGARPGAENMWARLKNWFRGLKR